MSLSLFLVLFFLHDIVLPINLSIETIDLSVCAGVWTCVCVCVSVYRTSALACRQAASQSLDKTHLAVCTASKYLCPHHTRGGTPRSAHERRKCVTLRDKQETNKQKDTQAKGQHELHGAPELVCNVHLVCHIAQTWRGAQQHMSMSNGNTSS